MGDSASKNRTDSALGMCGLAPTGFVIIGAQNSPGAIFDTEID